MSAEFFLRAISVIKVGMLIVCIKDSTYFPYIVCQPGHDLINEGNIGIIVGHNFSFYEVIVSGHIGLLDFTEFKVISK